MERTAEKRGTKSAIFFQQKGTKKKNFSSPTILEAHFLDAQMRATDCKYRTDQEKDRRTKEMI